MFINKNKGKGSPKIRILFLKKKKFTTPTIKLLSLGGMLPDLHKAKLPFFKSTNLKHYHYTYALGKVQNKMLD